MIPERVAVVTDSGSSARPEYEEVRNLGVTVVPLDIKFYENGQWTSYSDQTITLENFYKRMREGKKLPQTSGSIIGTAVETYLRLAQETNSVISLHITSKHSVAWESAALGAKQAQEEKPELLIEVVDSKQLSLGTWFLAEHAAFLSQKGANLEQIKEEVLEMIPNIQLYVVLETFENLKQGGRANDVVQAYLAALLKICPILKLKDGKLALSELARTSGRAKKRMVEIVGDSGKLVKMAILHTNAAAAAEGVKTSLGTFYAGEILIRDAGPVLGVHGGEGAVGIVFQKA